MLPMIQKDLQKKASHLIWAHVTEHNDSANSRILHPLRRDVACCKPNKLLCFETNVSRDRDVRNLEADTQADWTIGTWLPRGLQVSRYLVLDCEGRGVVFKSSIRYIKRILHHLRGFYDENGPVVASAITYAPMRPRIEA